jgi:DNA replication protein DnaC
LTGGEWIRQHQTLLITGPTGTGKTWLACALGNSACRQGHSVRYVRVPRLLGEDLVLARADGSYAKVMHTLARTDLLILDDWGLAPLGDRERRDLLELVEDRVGRRATLVTSQLPVDHWHEMIGDPTFGDAILDRLVHHAHRLTLTGGSLRRLPTPDAPSD